MGTRANPANTTHSERLERNYRRKSKITRALKFVEAIRAGYEDRKRPLPYWVIKEMRKAQEE